MRLFFGYRVSVANVAIDSITNGICHVKVIMGVRQSFALKTTGKRTRGTDFTDMTDEDGPDPRKSV